MPEFREWLAQVDKEFTQQGGGLLLAQVPFWRLSAMYENGFPVEEAVRRSVRIVSDH